ncbi:MAG: hypothetical protein MEQ74_04120 [Paracoccus sp.]|nr:hypothetical protein [Paracoccus sp. (in: a-proteobacteria)]
MTRTHFASTAALIALMAGATPGLAQTAPTELPALLQGLALDRVTTETKRDGKREYEGYLSDGTQIEAEFDMAGNLLKIEADDGALPAPVLQSALPAAVRDHPALALFARVEEIKLHPRHLEVKGWQENGDEIEVKFAPDNTLIEVETDDTPLPQALIDAILPQAVRGSEVLGQFGMIEEIKAEYGRFEVKGEDADGQDMRAQFDEAGAVLRFARDGERRGGRDRAERGPRGDGPRGDGPRAEGPRGDRPHRDGPRGDGPRGDRGAMAPAAQIDTVAANQRLTEAGYTQFGLMRQQGRRLMLDATNPDGEAVTLELDLQGQLVRETAR